MTHTQPDFSSIFHQTFAALNGPVRYCIRQDGNLLHDLAFLSSLTHDARILSRDVLPEKGAITIALNRDCWERGYTKHERSLELHVADSALHLTGVQKVRWRYTNQVTGQPWLDYLWIDRRFRRKSQFEFYLIGEHWRCTITLAGDDWTIRLIDAEMPYLWSFRNEKSPDE
ncbi:MAG TPA: hypothetical protein DCY13_03190 [Verrucomicrobiales bacterium]|nr:hypothetical protein [Verrucomicrobiales bacterium]